LTKTEFVFDHYNPAGRYILFLEIQLITAKALSRSLKPEGVSAEIFM